MNKVIGSGLGTPPAYQSSSADLLYKYTESSDSFFSSSAANVIDKRPGVLLASLGTKIAPTFVHLVSAKHVTSPAPSRAPKTYSCDEMYELLMNSCYLSQNNQLGIIQGTGLAVTDVFLTDLSLEHFLQARTQVPSGRC